MSEILPILRLNPHADKRLRAGHNWIYSNEVDNKKTPLREFEVGGQAVIESARGKVLGIATVNPHTLLCGRMVSRDPHRPLDKSLFVHRIKQALSLRQCCFDAPYYRLLFGDSDAVSGLVVDRFDDVLVIQISSAGMELVKDELVDALEQCLRPKAILLKNDGRIRQVEGLSSYVSDALGTVQDCVMLRENAATFSVPIRTGQKTGWFYDHRLSRAQMQGLVAGKRVLDLFSYIGGWGIEALVGGAESALCIDSSASALAQLQINAQLNGVQRKISTMRGSAFECVQQLVEEKANFDVVVVDPPAFIQRRKDLKQGLQAYRRINELALRLLRRNGLLVTASCSMHMSREMLIDVVRQAARHVDRQAQIFMQGGQGPDHPIHPSILETEYLKTLFCWINLQ